MTRGAILIVDDEVGHLQLLALALGHLPYTIIPTDCAQDALTYLAAEIPALILLDLAMPEVSGEAFLDWIQSDARLLDKPIVVVTAVPMRLTPEQRTKVFGVLPKPFDLTQLEAMVVAALGAAQA